MFENIFRNAIEYKISEQFDLAPFKRAEIEFTEDGDSFVDFDGFMEAINSDIEKATYRICGFISQASGKITITMCYAI